MTFLAILNMMMEVLAAAPSATATVEEAINAFHNHSNDNGAKVAAVADAAKAIATTATNVALSVASQVNSPTPPSA